MKALIVLGGVLLVVLALVLAYFGIRNGIIKSENAVQKSWGDVEAAYQRRLDSIPKHAQTAQFSADFQRKLQQDYVQGREGIKNAAATGDPEALQKAANDGYQALVIAVRAEAVPEAKLDQLTELNAEIESIERSINHERKAFDDAVNEYNDKVRTAPGSWFGFAPKKPFAAEAGAEKSPEYKLDLK